MIRLAGLRPQTDIKIEYIGLRPGEKIFEELFHAAEPPAATDMPDIMRATSRPAELEPLKRHIAELITAARARLTNETLTLVEAIVPEYASRAAAAPVEQRAAR